MCSAILSEVKREVLQELRLLLNCGSTGFSRQAFVAPSQTYLARMYHSCSPLPLGEGLFVFKLLSQLVQHDSELLMAPLFRVVWKPNQAHMLCHTPARTRARKYEWYFR